MSYDSSNMEIQKGYKTPFRRSGHIYYQQNILSKVIGVIGELTRLV